MRFGACISVLFQTVGLRNRSVTGGKGVDRPLAVYVIAKQASVVVGLCGGGGFVERHPVCAEFSQNQGVAT